MILMILVIRFKFWARDFTTETFTAVRKPGAEGKNQDIPNQQQFQESDEDDIALSHTVNWNRIQLKKWLRTYQFGGTVY